MKNKGFSLLELLVVIVIAMLTMGVIYAALKNLYKTYRDEIRESEAQLNRIFEFPLVLDIKNAGFGVPDNYTDECPSVPGESFDKVNCAECLADRNEPPKPICVCNNKGLNNSDILVIHSSVARVNEYTRSFGFLFYNETKRNFDVKEISGPWPADLRVNVISPPRHGKGNKTAEDSSILKCVSQKFLFTKSELESGILGEQPESKDKFYFLYGIGNEDEVSGKKVPPFNTVVYYLKEYNETSRFAGCCECTGVLERAYRLNDGSFKSEPILDCVLDFQLIVYDNSTNEWKNFDGSWDVNYIERYLKGVVVFIVKQIQQSDNGTYNGTHYNGTLRHRNWHYESSYNGSVRELMKKYRWKVRKYQVYLENLGVH